MPFSSDWRTGLAHAAENYWQVLIAEALPAAYDDYKMRIDIGIAFEDTESDIRHMEHSKQLAEKSRQEVLDGRALLGEPKDFNY